MIEPSWSRKRRVPRIRFAHVADLHLDSPFKGLRAAAPGHVADALYAATFKAWGNIVDLCIAEQVDALLVAGDIYDGADRSLRALFAGRLGSIGHRLLGAWPRPPPPE